MPRSAWACGRAMFTIVESSTTMSWATATTARASQRLGYAESPLRCFASVVDSMRPRPRSLADSSFSCAGPSGEIQTKMLGGRLAPVPAPHHLLLRVSQMFRPPSSEGQREEDAHGEAEHVREV